ncbi:MAG: HAMP domain-containing sensor histidine kinase [Paracoccaceae bacterium]
MDRANILSGAAFRTATHAALAVVAAFSLTGFVSFSYLRATLDATLAQQVRTDEIMLHDIYDAGGKTDLVQAISEINNPLSQTPRVIGVFDTDGIKLAGNIDNLPPLGTSRRIELTTTDHHAKSSSYYLNSTRFADVTLVLGQDLALTDMAEKSFLWVLLGAGVVLTVAILAIGYTASRSSLVKLTRLERTLDLVSQGQTDARVPVKGMDQIDRIADRVNAHLERLSSLMLSTRTTAAAIAHDLRTPLSRAFLSLQEAQSRLEKGQDPRAAIEAADGELTGLGRIFDAILRIARIGAETGRHDFSDVDLVPILADLTETFAPIAEENGQSLTLIPGPAAAPISGDSRMLRQMLVNLIQNALTHCPKGAAVTLAVKAEATATSVEVADAGHGIPEAERARVFDPFFRLDRNRTTPGSGLGLALVKAIADRHGATVNLSDNQPGLKVAIRFPGIARFVQKVSFASDGGKVKGLG